NHVSSFSVRGAFFELHCLVADDAANEIDQRAFIVVGRRAHILHPRQCLLCQSAFKFDPVSASNFDPFERRVLTVALASSELARIAVTWPARAAGLSPRFFHPPR